MKKKICFWTIAFGDNYEKMARTLVKSFRNAGFTDDFKVFSKNDIVGIDTLSLYSLEHKNYFFKFDLMKKLYDLTKDEYEFYAFVDCDSFFVRKNEKLREQITSHKFFSFLEQDIRACDHWATKSKADVLDFFKWQFGNNGPFYNVNGGFFSVHSDTIDESLAKATSMYEYLIKNNFGATDEIIIAALSKLYNGEDLSKLLIENNLELYATDTGHHFRNSVPKDEFWTYGEWFSSEEFPKREWRVNPSLVHAPGCKNYLMMYDVSKKHKMTIVVACSRLRNLIYVLSSIEKWNSDSFFDLDIIIVFDMLKEEVDARIITWLDTTANIKYFFKPHPNNKRSGGNNAKNHAISMIDEGFIYQLDDDNILFPDFFRRIYEQIESHRDKKCFIFGQKGRYEINNSQWEPRTGSIDTAMYLVDKSLIKHESDMIPEEYGGDGKFIENIYNKNREFSIVLTQSLCYYNKLQE